jgi:hypothetical protein
MHLYGGTMTLERVLASDLGELGFEVSWNRNGIAGLCPEDLDPGIY